MSSLIRKSAYSKCIPHLIDTSKLVMENKIVLTVVINEDINGNSSSTFISVYTYGTCGEGEHR